MESSVKNVDAADKSRSLKMVAIWQPWRPRRDTVGRWMLPVNIYLRCECVSVCGAAWRQELLWGFICGMTRQPVIYEHLELLFKHSLISRQTFPEARARARVAQTRQDLTPSARIPPSPWAERWRRTSREQPVKARARARVLQRASCECGFDS